MMYLEIIQKLTEWIEKDVVIVGDTLGAHGEKVSISFHGSLVEAAHQPEDKTSLFSIDKIIIRTSDMSNGYICFPTDSIEQVEMFPTEVKITKTNGYKTTITLNQK